MLDIKLFPESHEQLAFPDGFLAGLRASTLDYDDRPVIGIGGVGDDRSGAIALLQRTFSDACGQDAFETVLEQIRGPPLELVAWIDPQEIEERLSVPGFITAGVLYFEGAPRGYAQCTNGGVMQRFSCGSA